MSHRTCYCRLQFIIIRTFFFIIVVGARRIFFWILASRNNNLLPQLERWFYLPTLELVTTYLNNADTAVLLIAT